MAEVAKASLAKATIRLRTIMTSVQARSGSERAVCVRTSNAQDEYFDAVVITTPLGWLKRHKEDIRPLPLRVSEAIDSISYGRLEKVSLQSPHFTQYLIALI